MNQQNNMLHSREEIIARIKWLAEAISEDYKNDELHIVAMINGASFFAIDLIKELKVPIVFHQFGFSSYANANSTGEVSITRDIQEPLFNKHVLILEGVIVSGRTPKFIYDYLSLRKPASIRTCAIGIKRKLLIPEFTVDYTCFEFTDEVVVGYGIGSGNDKSLPFLIDSSAK